MHSFKNTARIAAFVRGFFLFLDTRNVKSAVLHGGENGFEEELTDVDFVVDPAGFKRLTRLVSEYCEQSGWRLCQVLRHEDTAAFCVCCPLDDPRCAVALDACTDYQRNGAVFIESDELLANRAMLDWGGHALSKATELKYRFIKAVAKKKDIESLLEEIAEYDESEIIDLKRWLREKWGRENVDLEGSALQDLIVGLHAETQRNLLLRPQKWWRVLMRLMMPTGACVVTGEGEEARRFCEDFSSLYFRGVVKTRQIVMKDLSDVVRTKLVITSCRPGKLMRMLMRGNVFVASENESFEAWLQKRVMRREGLAHN